jgi:hypothetical protein
MSNRAWGVAVVVAAMVLGAPVLAAGPSDRDCLGCHSGGALDKPSLDVDTSVLKASVHGEAGVSCVDCHADLAGVSDFPHGAVKPPACGTCHSGEEEAVGKSAHVQKEEHSPRCWSCHGGHDVLKTANKDSRVNPLNQPRTCLKCHADAAIARDHGLPVRENADAFARSVHYQQMLGGNPAAPACTTCHGAHDNVSHRDPNSPIARKNVPATCGMCHSEIAAHFKESVHGTMLAQANPDVPTCTGCHVEHAIVGPKDPGSPVAPLHISKTCSHCHENEALAKHYGLASSRLATFLGSYHGAASELGKTTVANCASCHGSHDIRPSSDPKSSIHVSNLTRTCGRCHPQAGLNFSTGKIHVGDQPGDNFWAWAIKRLYVSMITAVIGGFVLLIAVDLWGHYRVRRASRSRA